MLNTIMEHSEKMTYHQHTETTVRKNMDIDGSESEKNDSEERESK